MLKSDRKHKLEYQQVFFYTRITSKLITTDFSAKVSTPFTYKDGTPMELYVEDDVVRGVGQRNFQRDRLYNNRGKIIISSGNEKHKQKIIGNWDKVKNTVTLYPTEKLEPNEIKVLCLLQKHLTNNNITTIIDIDERNRFNVEIRIKKGDRIFRDENLVGEHFRNNNSDEDEEENEDW